MVGFSTIIPSPRGRGLGRGQNLRFSRFGCETQKYLNPNHYVMPQSTGIFQTTSHNRKGRLKPRIELILLSRQSVLFGEGTQRALQHGNRAVNQTAAAASGQQLAQALQGAEVV